MSDRRTFLGQLGGTAALTALSSKRILGANDRIRFALIGAGGRGKEIFKAAIECTNVEPVAVADLYTRRLDEAKAIAPGAATHRDFRRILDDKSIDAVLIATPQHMHVLNFVPAIQAGKDVYQEKTMAFNPEHARRMQRAFEGSGRVVQIGMQMNSAPGLAKLRDHIASGDLGTVAAIEAHHYRNSPYGGWMRQIPDDCDEQHVDWRTFEGESKPRPFDPQRFLNWRFYWDYSGGNVFENMVHQVGFYFQALDLKIPETVTMTGGNYFSPKMQVPDVMNVVMNHGEKVLFTWNSMFSNNYYGEGHDYIFGNKGTVLHNEADEVVFLPQGKKGSHQAQAIGASAGYFDVTGQHMQNFFDCVRSRKQPNCPFEMGFRSAIACQMAITSYRQQRTVRWDPVTEDIV